MMRKYKIIIPLLLLASTAYAVDLRSLKPTFWERLTTCTWHISCYFQKNLGTTVTTINGGDQISTSRVTINNNFSALNNGKIENSTTTLPYLVGIGTITSGTWTATPIGVAYGGTGTTSPSTLQVMLGNGASGLTMVSGFGTTGQLLTSNGSGAAPTWGSASFDTTQSYNLTGSFLGIKNLNASSTAANPIKLNGLTYNTPSIRAASSTALMEDGSGNLIWDLPDWQEIGESVLTSASTSVQVTGLLARKVYKINFYSPGQSAVSLVYLRFNGDDAYNYQYNGIEGSTWTTATSTTKANGFLIGDVSANGAYNFDATVNNPASTIKLGFLSGSSIVNNALVPDNFNLNWTNTSVNINRIQVGNYDTSKTFNVGTRITVYAPKN